MLNIIAEQPTAGAKESFSWLTDIIESQNGSECRIGLRDHPRVNYEYSVIVHTVTRNSYHNLIRSNFTESWLIPDWFLAKLYGPISAYSDTLNNVFNQKIGEKFLIYQDDRHVEVNCWIKQKRKAMFKFTDKKSENNRFKFDEDDELNEVVNINFTKNNYRNAYIMPLKTGILLNAKYSTGGYDAKIELQFDVTGCGNEYDGQPAVTYKSIEVLHNSDGINESLIKKDVSTIDYETGKITRLEKWDKSKNSRTIKFYLSGYDEILKFKEFIHRTAGRLNPFWFCDDDVAIYQFDMRDNKIIIQNNFYINLQTFKYIALFSSDDVTYAEVLSIDVTEKNTVLTIDKKPDGKVLKISNLMLCRFDSDTVQISYEKHQQATSEIQIIEVFDDQYF